MSNISQNPFQIMDDTRYKNLCQIYQAVSKLAFPYSYSELTELFTIFSGLHPRVSDCRNIENRVIPEKYSLNLLDNKRFTDESKMLFAQSTLGRFTDGRTIFCMTSNFSRVNSKNEKINDKIQVYKKVRKEGERITAVFRFAICLETGQLFVLKRMRGEAEISRVHKIYEKFFSRAKYPECIMQPYYVFFTEKNQNKKLNIVMPIYPENLSRFICKDEFTFNPEEHFYIFKGLLTALINLKMCGVLHRDLKPGNILMSKKYSVVTVIDFGLSCFSDDNKSKRSLAGTISYISPEKIKAYLNKNPMILATTFKSDVYSMGVTFYRLLEKSQFPFSQCALRPGMNGKFSEQSLQEYSNHLSKDSIYNDVGDSKDSTLMQKFKYLVKMMLKSNPKERWDAQQCLDYFNKEIVPFIPSTSADDDSRTSSSSSGKPPKRKKPA